MAKEELNTKFPTEENGTSELADGNEEASETSLQKEVEGKVNGLVLEEPPGYSFIV